MAHLKKLCYGVFTPDWRSKTAGWCQRQTGGEQLLSLMAIAATSRRGDIAMIVAVAINGRAHEVVTVTH